MTFDSKLVLAPSPFAVAPVMLGWVYDRQLQRTLHVLMDDPQLRQLGIAVVDLTHHASAPSLPSPARYAGFGDDRQIFVGSLPKIAIMLAAYRLREQVREAAVRLGLVDAKALFPELVKAWTPQIVRAAQGRSAAFPRLKEIFDTSGNARDIQFSNDFDHEIILMIEGVGKNSAAAYCAQRLGFAYINGVLKAEGLQGGRLGKGLSFALDYGGNIWSAGLGGPTVQGATAKAVAAFLTALQTRNLVSETASNEMYDHMLLASSWFKAGLAEKGRAPLRTIAKIGVFGGYSEGAIIERHAGKFFRYAAVVLGAPNYEVLWRAVVNLDILMQGKPT